MNLFQHLAAHSLSELGGQRLICSCGWMTSETDYPAASLEYADHSARAWREARTITTSEEVADLPDDTFITFFMNGTDEPFSYEVHRIRNGLPHGFDKGGLDRWLTCTHIRVLYRPDEDGAQ